MTSTNPEKIGRYQILERVGKGGMGVLYRGVDPVLDREVAIKVMLVDFTDDTEQMRPRFYREAQAAAKLQHSNIVTIFEFAEDNNTPYIVMEFLRGTPLDARMKSPIPLTLDDKLNIVAQLCGALNYAHAQGVVHRDIKPANLFLLPDGTVKLLDFGVAKLTTSTLTRQGDMLGSVSYMSPEQVSGSEAIDGRSDIFSVGVMLFELLTGRKPFKGDTPTATIVQILREDPPPLETLIPGIPPRLVAAVRRALAKEPGDRFPTAAEFAKELQFIRRSAPSAMSEAPGLDETRFASPAEMLVLNKQLQKDAVAKADSLPSPKSNRRWAIPLAVAAVALIGVAAITLRPRATPVAGEGAPAGAGTPAPVSATPAETPKTTVLRVETVPAGAEVVVDGRETGQTTPAPVTFSGPGPHTLRLSRRGFVSQEIKLTDADLGRGALTYTLAAAEVPKVAVTIASAYPVEVLSGSQTLAGARLSHQLSVPAGSRLRVVAREYLLDTALNVSGRGVQYNAPPLGRLTVLTKFETCNVKIGERLLGFPPITRMPIVSGQYRVDIVCPGGNNPPSQFVTVGANDTATVRIF
ncbi:MAG TPA: serine/threonine-protein kinase [Vicinamibacterales bacterium]|nr:serine/threonine-protein kinase [Vicinamibacterales bacterium]